MILAVVGAGPAHGYAVIEALKQRSGGVFELPEGTVYPALHRLEAPHLPSHAPRPVDAGGAPNRMARVLRCRRWSPGVSWLEELDRELRAARIPTRRRRRIVTELADHLASDSSSEERLGSPTDLARRFADEFGTAYTRRAGYAVFLALAPLGLLLGAVFVVAAVYTTNVDAPVTIGLTLGAELAFVGGVLALLRAWRTRRTSVLTAADARILVHRASLGIAGGALTVVTLAFRVFQARGVQWTVPELGYATVAVGAETLSVAAALTARAAVVHPSRAGAAEISRPTSGLPSAPGALRS
jgi:hypothetical protein